MGAGCGLASAFFFLIARRFYTRDYQRSHAYRQPIQQAIQEAAAT
jgi:hypothetical protein